MSSAIFSVLPLSTEAVFSTRASVSGSPCSRERLLSILSNAALDTLGTLGHLKGRNIIR